MFFRDPIYGKIKIEYPFSDLVQSPEVRRLSEVRLLNCISPTLATLSELTRYSHTIGVYHLSTKSKFKGFNKQEIDAFKAATLFHDAGTPPFGHLVEYKYKQESGWDHEITANKLFRGISNPETDALQIYNGITIKYSTILSTNKINTEIVSDILTGRHPLSKLLFGSIDLDNIDNVNRMAWGLGISVDKKIIYSLSSSLSVSLEGELYSEDENTLKYIHYWQRLRSQVYNILFRDEMTVSAQAVLYDVVNDAYLQGIISEDDWFLNDNELIRRLNKDTKYNKIISKYYLGSLPRIIIGLRSKKVLRKKELTIKTNEIIEFIKSLLKDSKVFIYTIKNKGGSHRGVELKINGENNFVGSSSEETLIYFFGSTVGISKSNANILIKYINKNHNDLEVFMKPFVKGGVEADENQQELKI